MIMVKQMVALIRDLRAITIGYHPIDTSERYKTGDSSGYFSLKQDNMEKTNKLYQGCFRQPLILHEITSKGNKT